MTDQAIDRLVAAAAARKATDLHLVVGLPPMIRLKGALVPLETHALAPEDTAGIVKQFLPEHCQVELAQQGAADFSARFSSGQACRVNAAKEVKGYALALRLLPMKVPAPETLGLTQVILNMMQRANGLILVAGPTGSGKSTSMAAMLQWHLNSTACHVVTVEQPIEYVLAHGKGLVTQFEVPVHVREFDLALAHMLRQDPDVIMVGEMRDYKTAKLALHAAETGHIVLATVHANGAPETIERVVSVFPTDEQEGAKFLLGTTIIGVLSQRLLPRQDTPTGRIMAWELLLAHSGLLNTIKKGRTEQLVSMIQTNRAAGMQLIDDHLIKLARAGLVSLEDARSEARFPDQLERAVNREE